jgi:hypothetical protein
VVVDTDLLPSCLTKTKVLFCQLDRGHSISSPLVEDPGRCWCCCCCTELLCLSLHCPADETIEVVDTDLLPVPNQATGQVHSVVPVSTRRGGPEKPIVILKLGKGQVSGSWGLLAAWLAVWVSVCVWGGGLRPVKCPDIQHWASVSASSPSG